MRARLISSAMAIGLMAGFGILVSTAALARGRRLGDPVNTDGTCSDGTSTFTLKSQFDDTPFAQTVGAEFQVDTGIIGQTWQVTLSNNGAVFFDAPVQTVAPEGALNVTHPDQGAFSVAHTILASAVNQDGGATCTGQVTLPALSHTSR
jgi:hypothetical protein